MADDGKTLVWENTFNEEDTYRGLYMTHRYHSDQLDNLIYKESPERIAGLDSSVVGLSIPGSFVELREGIRRLILLNIEGEEAAHRVHAITGTRPDDMLTSVFALESVAQHSVARTPQWKTWTHVWEQGFSSESAVTRYLSGNTPAARAETDQWRDPALGVLHHETYQFTVMEQSRPPFASEMDLVSSRPRVVIQHEVAAENVARLVTLLNQYYDPAARAGGMRLLSRWRTSGAFAETVTVQSTWDLSEECKWDSVRASLLHDERWRYFVTKVDEVAPTGRRFFSFDMTGESDSLS
ncbi:hypothetical protein [Arthrobacter sp. P2b]|uniref:hypothetical protein n=1 Tax=Arthrobacter sp. P2b TaxID=1938741 RepID=UPI0009A570FB|nr:hypothetical protein [Arthrobacter sp. P2b]SLK16478.1 hypothetical protein SAMN06272721_13018 [Arthrobacter sp. P2b]